jgi:uncharacterized protein YecT (DUF1311 family)
MNRITSLRTTKRNLCHAAKPALALLFFSSCCFEEPANAKNDPCGDGTTTAAQTACYSAALKKSDGDLNQLYQRIQTLIHGNELVKLKAAQRLWIQFRDANCAAEEELYSGGSAAPMAKVSCLDAMTKQRTEELKSMYDDRLNK